MAAGCALVVGVGGAVPAAEATRSGPELPDHGERAGRRHPRPARAALTAEPWGTAVALRLSDVTPGTRCRLIAVAADGRREVAGTWRADYEGSAAVEAATAIPLADLTRLVVVADRRGRLERPGLSAFGAAAARAGQASPPPQPSRCADGL